MVILLPLRVKRAVRVRRVTLHCTGQGSAAGVMGKDSTSLSLVLQAHINPCVKAQCTMLVVPHNHTRAAYMRTANNSIRLHHGYRNTTQSNLVTG